MDSGWGHPSGAGFEQIDTSRAHPVFIPLAFKILRTLFGKWQTPAHSSITFLLVSLVEGTNMLLLWTTRRLSMMKQLKIE